MAFVRICAHYFANNAWLQDGQLLRDAHRLAGIPAVLIHGRLDLASPLRTAWELAKAWPDAELKVIDEAGHTGSSATQDAILDAIERFGVNAHRPAGEISVRRPCRPEDHGSQGISLRKSRGAG
nr:alpha/beta hydrolase [Parafrankia elaeagni]